MNEGLQENIKNSLVEKWINSAIIKAKSNNIAGKHLTPYLLKEISVLSKGITMKANRSLIINNAKLAANIAKKTIKYLR